MKTIHFLVLCLGLLGCVKTFYPRGSKVIFKFQYPETKDTRNHSGFEKKMTDLLKVFSKEKKDFTLLDPGSQIPWNSESLSNAGATHAILVQIDSVFLGDYEKQLAYVQKNDRKITKKLKKYDEVDKVARWAPILPEFMVYGLGAEQIAGNKISQDLIDRKQQVARLKVKLEVIEISSMKWLWHYHGDILTHSYQPLTNGQQWDQLFTIISNSLRENVPFLKVN